MRFKNKVAIVTGAALGFKEGGPSIGSAIAFRFASEGASVVVTDINEGMARRTADQIVKEGGRAMAVAADVADAKAVKSVAEAAKKEYGALHCLVNVAASYGGDIFHDVVGTKEEDWKSIIDVNLNGYYRFAHHAIPLIKESGGGSIVNISSVAAFMAVSGFAVYPVIKAAINGLTRALAVDHAPEIRTNAICPGYVRIANSEGDRTEEELKKRYDGIAQTYPMKRLCEVEEIASVAAFLASDDSSFVNGECIRVDGGKSVRDTFDF